MKAKKAISLFLALVMAMSCMSMSAWATGNTFDATADSPTISTPEDLDSFAAAVNNGNTFKDKTVTLTADINLNNEPWTPIGTGAIDNSYYLTNAHPFEGTFVGGDHTISGLTVDTTSSVNPAGLFGVVANEGSVSNLNVQVAGVTGTGFVGGVTGILYGGSVSNCDVTFANNGTISGTHFVGGVAGYAIRSASISSCTVTDGTIKATDPKNAGDGDDVGGIVGYTWNNSPVTECMVTGSTISAVRQGGGIVGLVNNTSVSDCTAINVTIECNTNEKANSEKAAKIAFGGLVGAFCNGGCTLEDSTVDGATLTFAQGAVTNNVRMGVISGGEYDTNDPKGYTVTETTATGVTIEIPDAAQLAAAIAAANDGDTIKLLGDVTLSETVTIPAGKTVTLDLNGHTIESTSKDTIAIYGNLTIQDTSTGGKIIGTWPLNVYNGGSMVFNSGSVEAQEMSVWLTTGSFATINGGTFTSADNAVVGTPGNDGKGGNTINITGGTFNGNITETSLNKPDNSIACGIYAANNDTWNITGGTFNITNGAGIVQRAGTATVSVGNKVVFNCSGTVTGKVGDAGTKLPCSPIVFDASAKYPGLGAGSGITINGGVYTCDSSVESVKYIEKTGDAAGTPISITGGSFSTAPDNDYIAEGFSVTGSGPYTVAPVTGFVAEIVNGAKYATLDAALANGAGQTITLLQDVDLEAGRITIDDENSYIIDLNNHDICGNSYPFHLKHGTLSFTGTGKIYEKQNDQYAAVYIEGSEETSAANYSVLNVGANVTLAGWSGIFIGTKCCGVVVNINGTVTSPGMNTHTTAGHGIYLHGNAVNTTGNVPVINVNNGATVSSSSAADGEGIYAAGYGVWNLAGTVSGYNSAVELRAGTLNVTGGTFTATADSFSCTANGNGTTTVGAGIAIAQHDTKLPTSVTISGGTINGAAALSVSNPQGNNQPIPTLAVSGGTFTGVLRIDDTRVALNFITGGSFSTKPDASYLATGKTSALTNNFWVVGNAPTATKIAATLAGTVELEVQSGEVNAQNGESHAVSVTTSGDKISVPAKDMNAAINLTNSGGTQTVTVAEYLKTIIAKDNPRDPTSAEHKNALIAQATLNYGNAAAQYFTPGNKGYTYTEADNNALDDATTAVTQEMIDALASVSINDQNLPGDVQFLGASLVLKGATELRLNFRIPSRTSYSFFVDSVSKELVQRSDLSEYFYLVVATNISPEDYDKTYNVTYNNGTGSLGICNVCVNNYVKKLANDGGSTIANRPSATAQIGKALYQYWKTCEDNKAAS